MAARALSLGASVRSRNWPACIACNLRSCMKPNRQWKHTVCRLTFQQHSCRRQALHLPFHQKGPTSMWQTRCKDSALTSEDTMKQEQSHWSGSLNGRKPILQCPSIDALHQQTAGHCQAQVWIIRTSTPSNRLEKATSRTSSKPFSCMSSGSSLSPSEEDGRAVFAILPAHHSCLYMIIQGLHLQGQ